MINNLMGLSWLCDYAGIKPFQDLKVTSITATKRKTEIESDTGKRTEYYPEKQRIASNPIAHLYFHLRYEYPNLECLKRLFDKLGKKWLQDWINEEPTGQYSRRACFLYEWLTDDTLTPPRSIKGNYVDVLDNKYIMTASEPYIEKCSRWRVNNNIAGTSHFSPIIRKTPRIQQIVNKDLKQLFEQLNQEIGEDLLLRSAQWFTFGESKASFKLEGEIKQQDKIQRFAQLISTHTGKMPLPYDWQYLQKEILGKTTLKHFGLRQSPVFVGQVHKFQEIVHYIAPHYDSIADKLNGLMAFYHKTQGQSSIIRSAVIAFAFVYIHPLADGNGRIHRFLFNDILRRDGITTEPFIFPLSSIIANHTSEKIAYSNQLNTLSQVLMHNIQGLYSFSHQEIEYADGIYSNFIFRDYDLVEPFWRYLDLTQHAIYFDELLDKTLYAMKDEALYLQQHDQARDVIKNIVDMPNHYVDRIIRSILDNNGILSNKLAKEYEFLQDNDLWAELVQQVQAIFSSHS